MATSRSILCRSAKCLPFLTRSFVSSGPLAKTTPASSLYTSSLLSRSRPVIAAFSSVFRGGLVSVKALSTQATSSSLNDPNPNWSNRPPKETMWLVAVEPPEGEPTRDEIIYSYIKTLAQIVGSEEEARMKIYSVSTTTRCFVSSGPLAKTPASSLYTSSLLSRSRPLIAASSSVFRGGLVSVKALSTQATSSSLNWPPKETILLDGCDFEHWLVVVDPPEGEPTRDEIIDSYVKTLAQVVGSEEEARMKIYLVSTTCYFAFGALVSEALSHKLKESEEVRWVFPDFGLDVRNKKRRPYQKEILKEIDDRLLRIEARSRSSAAPPPAEINFLRHKMIGWLEMIFNTLMAEYILSLFSRLPPTPRLPPLSPEEFQELLHLFLMIV